MFKFETGVPLGKYIRGVRMNAAKELLADTNLNTREIGEMVGYGDAASFTKAFKRCVGVTPGRYRDEIHIGHCQPAQGRPRPHAAHP